jgi:hypothetical protein
MLAARITFFSPALILFISFNISRLFLILRIRLTPFGQWMAGILPTLSQEVGIHVCAK